MARAALDLLRILHARLQVLISSGEAGGGRSLSSSGSPLKLGAPNLWGTCWVPIIRVLTEGALDPRTTVCLHALTLLRDAIVNDPHAKSLQASDPALMHSIIVR